MEIRTTVDAQGMREIITRVSVEAYGGNIVGTVDDVRRARDGRNVLRVKIAARDSRGIGARRSGSGRRGPWACWHVFRDVLATLYIVDASATALTALTRYDGAHDFSDRFESTAAHNIGSMVAWRCLADACECESGEINGRDHALQELDYAHALDRVIWRQITRGEALAHLATVALSLASDPPAAVGARAARHGR